MTYHTRKHFQSVADAVLDPPDPQVTAELRAVTVQVPYHTVDWDAVRASIIGDAAALFRRRVRRPWTVYVARWTATALPVGIAASFVAGMFVFYTSRMASQTTDEVALTPAGLLSTVTGISTGTELAATVMQPLRATESRLSDGVVP